MNQDHLQQQPAADAYVIGGPSDFAEDLSSSGPGWKADLDSDGNTKRDEIGMPSYRGDTFNNPEKSPGVSPSRQASVREIHAKAELATRVARLMLSRTASEVAVENQALVLMDLPLPNLQNTLQRLAQDQGGEDDEDDGDDEGQQKQAADDEDDDGDDAQAKQAGELPKEFLEQQQKKKDEAKAKDDKGKDKEARSRKAQDQSDDDDEGQQKQARRRLKAQEQQDDDEDSGGQQKQARSRKAQDQGEEEDQGQGKQARRVKAQDQQEDEDEGQQKQADDQQQSDEEKQVGKEAYALIRKAATDLLALPIASRGAVFKAMLPSLAKVASFGIQQQGGQLQVGGEQLQAQVQQLVQQAMQQQQQAQQQSQAQDLQQAQQLPQQGQQQIADQALVDEMLQDGPALAEEQIQMDVPDMDMGLGVGGDEDPALQAIFASDSEVQRAMEARDIERGHQPTASRTASTRTVGTRPTAGVSQLGGGSSAGGASGADEINKLARMWSSAPDVSTVFRS